MRNWLIKFLGGFTEQEMAARIETNAEVRGHVLAEVAFLRDRNRAIYQDFKELNDAVYKRFGLGTPDVNSSQVKESSHAPVSTAPPSWSRLKKQLESDDRKRYWEDKNKKVEKIDHAS